MFSKVSRWIAYPLGWLLLMAVPMIVDAVRADSGATSAVNQFTIPRFIATYNAHRQGDNLAIDVTERITANFAQRYTNRGIERRLADAYGGQSIRISITSVTDSDGKPVQYTTRSEGGFKVLRIGNPRTYVYGQMDYVIKYTIGRGMVQASDRQEIYLDVNGTGWQQPFGLVQATLNVDPDLAGNLLGEQACYQGPAGSTRTCQITRSGTTFTTQGVSLQPRENVTIAVGFAQGTVRNTIPAPFTGFGWWGLLAMPAAGLLFLVFALIVRRMRLQRLLLRDDVPIRYTPPDVAPILAADFLGLPERGAAAQLAQLVIDKSATLSSDAEPIGTAPQPRGRLSRGDRDEVRDELRVQLVDPKALPADVRNVCKVLFGNGRSVRLSSIADYDLETASELRQASLQSSGLRRRAWAGAALFVVGYVALIAFGWVQLAVGLDGLGWPFLISGVLAVMLLVAGVHYYPTLGRLTAAGKQLRDELAGLHRFVTMAEADRIAWMQNAKDAPRVSDGGDGSLIDLYEPLLPYAIIFGTEGTWRQVLGDMYDRFPGQAARISLPTLQLALGVADSGWRRYRRASQRQSFWDSRPRFGEGFFAGAGRGIGEAFDSWASSRSDDRGGSSFGGGGGGWRSSSSRSSGSSGGGRSGGDMGGGGGGGW